MPASAANLSRAFRKAANAYLEVSTPLDPGLLGPAWRTAAVGFGLSSKGFSSSYHLSLDGLSAHQALPVMGAREDLTRTAEHLLERISTLPREEGVPNHVKLILNMTKLRSLEITYCFATLRTKPRSLTHLVEIISETEALLSLYPNPKTARRWDVRVTRDGRDDTIIVSAPDAGTAAWKALAFAAPSALTRAMETDDLGRVSQHVLGIAEIQDMAALPGELNAFARTLTRPLPQEA